MTAADLALWAITLAAAVAVGHYIHHTLKEGKRS